MWILESNVAGLHGSPPTFELCGLNYRRQVLFDFQDGREILFMPSGSTLLAHDANLHGHTELCPYAVGRQDRNIKLKGKAEAGAVS